MTTPARKRLMRDFKKLSEDPPSGVSGTPSEGDIMKWNCVIFGPQDTPFEDGTFKLSITFSEEYPNKAPIVKFVSKMFHPNIYADGSVCLDILQVCAERFPVSLFDMGHRGVRLIVYVALMVCLCLRVRCYDGL